MLAQVDRTYILATDGEAVVLIDQHAAHERVDFEQLSANARAHVAAEPLLIPYTFEVRPDEARPARRDARRARASGLHVEHVRRTRVPHHRDAGAARARGTHAAVRHRGFRRRVSATTCADSTRDQRVWASLACHSVVRAHERSAHPEMTALVERLQHCENPMHCPHGRPTIVRLEPERDHAALQARLTPGVLIVTGPTASGKRALALRARGTVRRGNRRRGLAADLSRDADRHRRAERARTRARAARLVEFVDPHER